jgi:hypothetical protein
MAKLNILIVNDGVFFHDVNSRNTNTLVVHCMNRTLFTGLVTRFGVATPHLLLALRESSGSFHTVVMEAEDLYDHLMSNDPITESLKSGRESQLGDGHPYNFVEGPLTFNIQWADYNNRVVAKSVFDPFNAVAWYSYEGTSGASAEIVMNLFTGVTQPTIESEVMEGLDSPLFLDLFNREERALVAVAGFEAVMRARTGLTRPAQSVMASPYLTDRPLKDIKGILTELGMNETDAITFAQNLGYAGLSTGSEFHNSLIRDIRGMLINKIK